MEAKSWSVEEYLLDFIGRYAMLVDKLLMCLAHPYKLLNSKGHCWNIVADSLEFFIVRPTCSVESAGIAVEHVALPGYTVLVAASLRDS